MDLETINNRAAMGIIVKSLFAARGRTPNAAIFAERAGAPAKVVRVLKDAVSVGYFGDPEGSGALADWPSIRSAFFELLAADSAFFRLWSSRALARVPVNTRVTATAVSATAARRDEAKPIPATKLTLAQGLLRPVNVGCILVVSDELADAMSASAQSLVTSELRSAVAREVDAEFLQLITDTATLVSAASGVTAAAARSDLRAMLEAVNYSGTGSLAWISSPGAANKLAALGTTSGGAAFPDVSPVGGELFGAPFLVSSGVAANSLHLVNGREIAADLGDLELKPSSEAMVQLDDDPTDPVDATTVQVSLWQHNLVGVKATVVFAAERVRDTALATLTDVNYGAAP